jgi:hypothetical protein
MKNISLILKIDKSTGKVIDSFGSKLSPNQKISSINTFALQHSIEKTSSGDLLVFNNSNIEADSTALSSLVIINDHSTSSLNERIVKNVSCLFDNNDDGRAIKFGSSEELPDGNILLGNGAKGRTVIIDPRDNYRIIQDIILKVYQRGIWEPLVFYRCHYTSSLYPNYFSLNKSKGGIEITNEGSEKDTYSIEFILKDGSKKTIQSNVIYSDDTFFHSFDLSTVSAVHVVSASNTRFKRSLSW